MRLAMTMRADTCPRCGNARVELVCAPSRFYCTTCHHCSPGPCDASAMPAGAQLTLTGEVPQRAAERDG